MCRLAADGSKLPCPEVFGALLGTAIVVSVLAVAMAFVPPRTLKKVRFQRSEVSMSVP